MKAGGREYVLEDLTPDELAGEYIHGRDATAGFTYRLRPKSRAKDQPRSLQHANGSRCRRLSAALLRRGGQGAGGWDRPCPPKPPRTSRPSRMPVSRCTPTRRSGRHTRKPRRTTRDGIRLADTRLWNVSIRPVNGHTRRARKDPSSTRSTVIVGTRPTPPVTRATPTPRGRRPTPTPPPPATWRWMPGRTRRRRQPPP